MLIPQTIQPAHQSDRDRWSEQALRYRLLTGKHRDDVITAIQDQFSLELAADMVISPDLSRNPYRLIYQQLNVAYNEPPEVHIQDDPDADLAPIVTPKLWAQQQQTSLWALSMGESLVRIDWKHWAGATEASYRVVQPDQVVVYAMPDEPDQPGAVEELRYRGDVFTWEVWDVRDPANPIFRIDEINDQKERVDATAKWAPELAGEGAYPYRATDGSPILPWVLYHRQVGSRLWNWTNGIELTDGALKLCSLWTFWNDGYINCAYPQRYALDVDTQAGVSRTIAGTPVDVVPVDRKSILKFSSKGPGGGSLGAFTASFDPLQSAEALRLYEQGLAVYAGLNPSDLQVTSAQSGYAIVVSREGQRRAQKLVEPSFRIADQQLLSTAAKMANFYTGSKLSENPRDYRIRYRSMKPSIDEMKAEADLIRAEVDMGVLSKLEALRRMHPEIESDEDALERLLRVNQIEAELAGIAAPVLTADDTDATSADQAAPVLAAMPIEEPEVDKLTALNGAQVQAAQGIVEAVAGGMLPRQSGVQMLASFFNMPSETAEQIMGSVGKTFTASPTEG
jgi:hypothetical protein